MSKRTPKIDHEPTKAELAASLLTSEQEVVRLISDNAGLRRRLDEAGRKAKVAEKQRDATLVDANVVDELINVIGCSLPALKSFSDKAPAPRKQASAKKVDETLVIHISDEHFGQVVLPTSVNGLESYNVPIALKRAETYVDKILEFTCSTLSNYNFEDVVIFCYGDHVNGDIHGGQEYSHLRNSFATIMGAGQMHAQMFRDIAGAFPHAKVRVVYVPGNHGRTTKFKDYNNPLRNQDYMIAETARALCAEIKNLEFLVPSSYSVNIKLYDFVFNVSHGDDIKSWNGIPWYGIERRTRRLQSIHAAKGENITYKVMGHFHNASSSSDPVGETIINGSWKATDEYLYNAFGGYGKPVQWIHGVHSRHGITWRLAVDLKTPNEGREPSRYKLVFANEDYNRMLGDAEGR